MRLTILHTNDIHGRVDGLARIATLVARIREETPHPVLYLDAADNSRCIAAPLVMFERRFVVSSTSPASR